MSKKFKIISIFLIIILMLTIVAPYVYALTGTYQYTSNENNNIQLEDEFLYRDDCFERSSFLGCSHLETLSAQVAIASASCYGAEEDKYELDYTQNSRNVVNILKDMEFENVATNKYYKLEKEENSAGVAVGHKKINVDGKEYTLLAIIPRSAGYRQEWVGNFTVGDGNIHEGFKAARDEDLRYVKKYINDFDIQGDIKVWTVGHSRGAAVSNMIGGFFAGGGIEYFEGKVSITPEDVYCYTYATPRPIKNNADKNIELSVAGNRADENYANDTPGEAYNYINGGQVDLASDVYKGIRNFILPSDIFPMLPPKVWGFTHYGKDIPVNHGKVTEEAMLSELKKTSEFAYNQYISGGSPNTFERKTFDLKTLIIVKDDGIYSAMDFPTFLDERMNGFTYNADTNAKYVDGGYQETLKALAGIYGMSTTLFDDNMLEDTSSIIPPLIYAYLAYASERLIEEGEATTETEAITIALEELLAYFTDEEIDDQTFTVDKFVTLFAKYISDNENEPIADTVISGICNLIPEDYQFIFSTFKEFDPNNTDENEVTNEEGLMAYIKACYYGPDSESKAAGSYENAEKTRSILYTLLYFALYSEHPEIYEVLISEDGNVNGCGKFNDFIGIVLDILKTEKDDDGNITNTYSTISDLADEKLRLALDTIFEEPLEKSQNLYGAKFKNQLQYHIDNLKAHISQFRRIILYALVYEDGDYSAVSDIKNVTTFLGNTSIVPLAHYNEVNIAYAKAARNYDCGYQNHDKPADEDTSKDIDEETISEADDIKEQEKSKNDEKRKKSDAPGTGDAVGKWFVISIALIIVTIGLAKIRARKS